ncbi:MAG: ABC transporter permease [Oscillospiraceae bacterium]|nr:ABC transporter permease [Oscillospiraceae bacterium]
MGGLILFRKLTGLTLGRLCRQLWLLAGLAALCALLPLAAGRAAEEALSGGVDFSGIILAVTAAEGDPLPEQLERTIGGMSDVGQYCSLRAMEREEARQALEAGEATAVLDLPENFIRRVQSGENPAVEILVDGSRPLESLLTLWVGQSAADLLAASQAGIYAVLEQYDLAPPVGLTRDQAVMEINLKYVQWTLNRQELFREEKLLPTSVLPISLHYRLSLLAYLVLSTAPLFAWICQGPWIAGLRRLRYARRSPLWALAAGLASCWAVMTAALFILLKLAPGLPAAAALETAAVWGAFFAGWAAFCALLTHTAAGCGGLSFLLALAMLAASGGIVPPVLLPEGLRQAGEFSPITWMRALAAKPLGYDAAEHPTALLLAAAAALCALSAWLYIRRANERGEKPL